MELPPAITTTTAYPPPRQTALLRAYLVNSASCGAKFYMIWTAVEGGITFFTITRTGHVKTGLGTVTEKPFPSEEKMTEYVLSQIADRKKREGDKRFFDAPVPLALPASIPAQGKETKGKENGDRAAPSTNGADAAPFLIALTPEALFQERPPFAKVKRFLDLLGTKEQQIQYLLKWRDSLTILASHADFETLQYVLRLYPDIIYLGPCCGGNSLLLTAVLSGRQEVNVITLLANASPKELIYGGQYLSKLAEEKECGDDVVATLEGLMRAEFDNTHLFYIVQTSRFEEFQRQIFLRDKQEVLKQLISQGKVGYSYSTFHALIFSDPPSSTIISLLSFLDDTARSKICSVLGSKVGYPLFCLIGTRAGRDIALVRQVALAHAEAISSSFVHPYRTDDEGPRTSLQKE
ncbi:hypothetical protein TrVE_jg11737 [Triparma verrucosa]|uniref:Uncharacterized protein n=1 Tax=Triparma verrucosa TaxID=1606542 RepID=A0A9W7CDU9_9STRA|nr:hypothetical protein TrVE_jg11737 [Triparma verrucosa]